MINFKRVLTSLCCLMLLLSLIPAVADDGFSTSYTYTYDYWEDVQESPDSYRVAAIIDAETLGLEKLDNIRIKNPQSLFVKDNYLYVCDTDNNRILVIERDGSQYVLADVISGMTGAEGEAAPAEIDPETGEIEKPEETEGMATDAESIRDAAARMAWALENKYVPPRNFYGVGGMKIFRDLVWLMRGLMREDHRFYRAHGLYDFPQKRWPRMLGIGLLGAVMRSKRLRRLVGKKMNDGMLAPYQEVIERTGGKT